MRSRNRGRGPGQRRTDNLARGNLKAQRRHGDINSVNAVIRANPKYRASIKPGTKIITCTACPPSSGFADTDGGPPRFPAALLRFLLLHGPPLTAPLSAFRSVGPGRFCPPSGAAPLPRPGRRHPCSASFLPPFCDVYSPLGPGQRHSWRRFTRFGRGQAADPLMTSCIRGKLWPFGRGRF